MIGLIANPIVQKIALALGVLALIFGAYKLHVNSIEQAQMLKDQNAQLTQVVKDMQELQKKTAAIDEASKSILAETSRKNEVVTNNYREVRTYLDTPEARAADRAASEPVKETIRILKKNEE